MEKVSRRKDYIELVAEVLNIRTICPCGGCVCMAVQDWFRVRGLEMPNHLNKKMNPVQLDLFPYYTLRDYERGWLGEVFDWMRKEGDYEDEVARAYSERFAVIIGACLSEIHKLRKEASERNTDFKKSSS